MVMNWEMVNMTFYDMVLSTLVMVLTALAMVAMMSMMPPMVGLFGTVTA